MLLPDGVLSVTVIDVDGQTAQCETRGDRDHRPHGENHTSPPYTETYECFQHCNLHVRLQAGTNA